MSTQKSWKAYRGALEMTCPAVPFMYGGVLSGNIFVGGCSDPVFILVVYGLAILRSWRTVRNQARYF